MAAIISGSSNVLYGVGSGDLNPGEDPANFDPQEHGFGLKMTLRAGDVIVHPAGTGHSNVCEDGDYRYLAFFPHVGSPLFRLPVTVSLASRILAHHLLCRVHHTGNRPMAQYYLIFHL